MNRRIARTPHVVWLVGLALLVAAMCAGSALAQALGYDLSWYTVDGGGGTSAGGAYNLSSTIGQPDAGGATGGGYTLAGGFWGGGAGQHGLFLPLLRR